MTSILIGVGGTGAKIVEQAIALMAAGLGPRQVYVGLVDQDNSNGNVARTKALIASYREFRQAWGGVNPSSVIDWRGDARGVEGLAFCGTQIDELFEDGALWCPGGDQSTLRNMIGQNLSDRQKDLFDLLFMPGEEEQDLPLGEGYRGRAHVGAAALIARLSDPTNPLTRRLGELMEGGGGRERVNIFLAGSSFGGTGAAGFPTIARELHRIRSAPDFANRGEVAIGGALMLPYFGFAPPDEEQREMVVTTDELLPKAQLALEHYGSLFDSEKTFERFYLIGWDRFFQLGYHEAGNLEQCNPPLLPELFGAAAALDFLAPKEALDTDKAQVDVIVSARISRDLRWEDFPIEGVEEKLGQLLRFAVYWRYVVADLIQQARPWVGKGNWTHRLTERKHAEESVQALFALDDLLIKLLDLLATLEHCSPQEWKIGPWRLRDLLNPTHDARPTDPVSLVSGHADATAIFSGLVRRDDGLPWDRDAAAVYDDLDNRQDELAEGAHRGYGRVVAAAYRAARLR